MSWFQQLNLPTAVFGGALVASTSLALYSTYKLHAINCKQDEENVYESMRSLSEYLVFHYGSPNEVCAWDFGPKSAIDFPKRCADLCIKYAKDVDGRPTRALDIGCAVGRSSFELTRRFEEVVGVDYSHSFISACNELRSTGYMHYQVTTVGDITNHLEAKIDSALDRSKTKFEQGDACQLSPSLGQFDMVLAANLICRLHTPAAFLRSMATLINPGGILVITSPYTFLREYTPMKNWVGGWTEDGTNGVTGFMGLKRLLLTHFDFVYEENMPFLIRETERKHQWTVAHATVWRRKV